MMYERGGYQAEYVLFVAGDSPRSQAAIEHLNRAFISTGRDLSRIEIVNVEEDPDRATAASILVTPTLVESGDPARRIAGDLSATQQLVEFLG
jgi:circadian clock protein KaiB